VGNGLPLVAGLLCIPYTLRILGNESFGILTLLWALIGYFSLFDLGVGRALTYEMSKLTAKEASGEIPPTLQAGILLTFCAGLFGAIVVISLAPSLASGWLKISPERQLDAKLAFQIAAIGVIPTTVTSGFRGALEGLGYFGRSNSNKIFLGFCMFILPPFSLMLHGTQLWVISMYLVGARFVVALMSVVQLRHYFFNTDNKTLLKQYLKRLLSYGFWVTVTGIIGPLMIYGDRFFVSATVGASQLPYYAIPQEGLQRLLILPGAICAELLPQLAVLARTELKATYLRNYRRMALIMFGVCALAALLAYPVLSFWISPEFSKKSLPIVLVLIVGIWLNSIATVPYTLFHAMGNPRITAIFHLIQLIIYILVLYWLTKYFGLIGAAVAWVVRVLLDLVMLHIASRKIVAEHTEKPYVAKSEHY